MPKRPVLNMRIG